MEPETPAPGNRVWLPSVDGGRFNDQVHVVLSGGSGVWAYTAAGKRLLDANSGLWHLSLGYAPGPVVEAAAAALRQLGGTSLLRRLHREVDMFAEALTPLLPGMDPVYFFGTSGSEAVDAALRIAFAAGDEEGRSAVAYLSGAYHGVSVGPLALNSNRRYRSGTPQVLDAVELPSPTEWTSDPGRAARLVNESFAEHGDRLAAVIVEPIQCVGGIVPVPVNYLAQLARSARAHRCLLIVDEVSTGVFRTGSFLAIDATPVRPDIVVLGKGLTAGITPMSVVAVERSVADAVRSVAGFRLAGSTQAGDPIGCAAARALLQVCADEEFAAHRQRSAVRIREELATLLDEPVVDQVVGQGHLWGVRLRLGGTASGAPFVRLLSELGLRHGMLLHPLSVGVVPVVPALTISEDELIELAARLRTVLREAERT